LYIHCGATKTFEWDDAKVKANFKKHGIRFAEAARVFEGTVFSRVDERETREVREICFGLLGHAVVVAVVHTDRHGVTCIISARKATKQESKLFFASLKGAFGGD
jgi:hypothetical protein